VYQASRSGGSPRSWLVIHLREADLLRRADGQKESGRRCKTPAISSLEGPSRGVMGTVAEALFEQMVLFRLNTCFNRAIQPPTAR